MKETIAVMAGYLAGSIPFAFLLARRRGVDLRRVGSGNIGAANVFRTTGAALGVAAMCLDAAKGALAVVVAERLTSGQTLPVVAALAAVIGHVYPVWLGFRGGKGVATAAGGFAVLSPGAMLIASGVFVVVAGVTRYVSVGSICGAVALVVAVGARGAPVPVVLGATAAALIIVVRHRANIARVMAGTENRIGQRA